MVTPTPSSSVEVRNMLHAGNKCGALFMTMSLKDWHKTLVGRLVPGNEAEVMEVCAMIADQLHDKYPTIVKSAREYMGGSNKDKPA